MIGTSGAAAQMEDSVIVEGEDGHPPAGDARRAYAPDNWTPDADAFECCCAACSSQDE